MFVWFGAIAVVIRSALLFWGGRRDAPGSRVAAGSGAILVVWTLFVAIGWAGRSPYELLWAGGIVAILFGSSIRLWLNRRKRGT